MFANYPPKPSKPKHPLACTQLRPSWCSISLSSSHIWHPIVLPRSKLSLVTPGCLPLRLTTDNLTIHAYQSRAFDVFLSSPAMRSCSCRRSEEPEI